MHAIKLMERTFFFYDEKDILLSLFGIFEKTYGEKVYKLPINLPVTCPNRLGRQKGCTFCAESGTGFEALSSEVRITDQLMSTRSLIEKSIMRISLSLIFKTIPIPL